MKYLGLFLLFIVALEARELRLNEPILGGTNHRLRRRRPEISGNKTAGPNVSFNPEDKELGKCKDLTIEFGKGFEGKENEVSYEPFDKTHQHGAALNMAIIVTFLCDELVNKCEFKNEDSIFKSCKKYATEMGAVKNNAKKADEWNGMWGYVTDYEQNPASGPGKNGGRKGGGGAAVGGGGGGGGVAGGSNNGSAANNNGSSGKMSPNGTPIGNTQLRVKDLNVKSEDDLPFIDSSTLGKCSDMKLEFGTSLQGRKADENAYEPTSTFHRTGSALKISIQIQYLCDQLRNKCFIKDTDPQFVGCKQVESFIGVQKNDGYWADLWNSRFGCVTDYENNPASGAGTGGGEIKCQNTDPGIPARCDDNDDDNINKGGDDGDQCEEETDVKNVTLTVNDKVETKTATLTQSSFSFSSEINSTANSTEKKNGNSNSGNDNTEQIDPKQFGDCSDVRIQYGTNFEERKDKFTFMPVDRSHFPHGAALDFIINANGICLDLINRCHLSAEMKEVKACMKFVASLVGPFDGNSADQWNLKFGYVTTYGKNPANGDGTGGKGDGPKKITS